MLVIIRIKNVYGNELIYPECETSLKFTSLTGKKTLSLKDMSIIKSLGYEVRVKQAGLTYDELYKKAKDIWDKL